MAAQACKVPVFRYALEHWYPDPYHLVILHRGPLSSQDQAIVTALKNRIDVEIASGFEAIVEDQTLIHSDIPGKEKPDPFSPKSGANLRVVQFDVAESNDHPVLVDALGAGYRDAVTSPQLVLLFPLGSEVESLVWRGKLSVASIDAILHSPARQKITKLILGGESVVWILIGSGDDTKAKVALATLHSELIRLEKSLVMRDVDVIKSQKQFGKAASVKLKLAFEHLVIDRNDPAESIFLSMLLKSEVDLEAIEEPILIPVFGRGRTYFAMAGKGINPEVIEETGRFLIEDCSCEIKRLNPGMDLLFNVKWDALINGRVDLNEPLVSAHGAVPLDEVNSQLQLMENEMSTVVGGQAAKVDSPGKQLMILILGMLSVALFLVLVTASRMGKKE